jgi:hypothetical protein
MGIFRPPVNIRGANEIKRKENNMASQLRVSAGAM